MKLQDILLTDVEIDSVLFQKDDPEKLANTATLKAVRKLYSHIVRVSTRMWRAPDRVIFSSDLKEIRDWIKELDQKVNG
ncbi:MAG: hypothetical protein WC957_03570 [Candidatus Neomarinimicrobiota bacterium]|jgi:hypothetical protein